MSCISINQRKSEIVLKIKEDAEQKEVMEELNKKIKLLKKLYQEEKLPIYVLGKVLKNKEIEEIQNLIKENIDVKVEFDSPKSLGLHSIKKSFEQEIKASETKFFKGSLRSGKKIEYEGSLVIIGDVNDGAEVISGENIIILGSLRGLAHAGAKGNKKAIIAAGALDTAQVRIASFVKEMEKGELQRRQSYIYVEGEEVIVE